MLVASNLSKTYRMKERKRLFWPGKVKEIRAVEVVSLEIKPGQIVGLLGLNGAGKTTTIRMLSAMLEPTSGSFSINGIDGIRFPQQVKRIVNVITGGERNIYWRLTALENLEYFCALYNVPSDVARARTKSLLSLVGLFEAADMPVERYSKGMKQRLQIARGLVNDPSFLFLDEPTLGLDVAIAKELRGYVKSLAHHQGKGLLLTTHYITEVEELCDWVYVIHEGRIIAADSPAGLARAADTNIEIVVTTPMLSVDVQDALRRLATKHGGSVTWQDGDAGGVSISLLAETNLTTQLVQTLANHDVPILQLAMAEPRLEDALIKLVSGSQVSA